MDQLATTLGVSLEVTAEPGTGAPSLFGLLGELPAVQLIRAALNAAFRSLGLDDSHEINEAVVPSDSGRMAICWTAPRLDLRLEFDRMGEAVLHDDFTDALSH